MRQGSILPFILFTVVIFTVVVLVNLYLVQPRLALQLESPEPLPSIGQMPSPPPGKQVATTMALIKKMASGKSETQKVFVPRQILRNPFLDSMTSGGKKVANSGGEQGAGGEEEFMPLVQMVMIGEYLKSALLDGVLVTEGDLFNGYRIDYISDMGVGLRSSGKTVMVPLGAYTTAALSRPSAKRAVKEDKESKEDRESIAPVKQKAALSDLLRRLEPLLRTDEKSVKNDK